MSGWNWKHRVENPIPILAHDGGWETFGKRYRRDAKWVRRDIRRADNKHKRDNAVRRRDEMLSLYDEPRNLMAALVHLAKDEAKTAGPDGETINGAIDGPMWYARCRELQRDLQQGKYTPGPALEIRVPKFAKPGTRELRIPNLIDRIVARAIYQVMLPFLDPYFDKHSFGFRPIRSVEDALRTAFRFTTPRRQIWVTHDIADAFGSIPQRRLFDLLAWVPEPIRGIIAKLVCLQGKRGIAQGSPLSPLLLNVYLDRFVDRPWRERHARTPLLRYADDMLIICGSEASGFQMSSELREMLIPAGMHLPASSSSTVADLSREQYCDWLGFTIRMYEGRPLASFTPGAFRSLQDALSKSRDHDNPQHSADSVWRGWLKAFRATYAAYDENERVNVVAEIQTTFERVGLKPPSSSRIHSYWRDRWLKVAGWNPLIKKAEPNAIA